MFKKITEYFQNSPKRIAGFWVLMHVFWLIFAIVVITIASPGDFDTLEMIPGLILFFPQLVVMIILSSVNLESFWLASGVFESGVDIFYYSLFFLMVYSARKTDSFLFKICQIIFAGYFFLSLAGGLYMLFVGFYF